jgi:hypothetical protein
LDERKSESGEGRMAMIRKVVADWPQVDFPSISDLTRPFLGIEKEREWRRKDDFDEGGG